MDLSGSWEYIEKSARSRLANNITPRHVSDYGEMLEIIGVAGEICARRFLGLSEKVHLNFDRGVDIEFAGKTIDVKATLLASGIAEKNLQWRENKIVKADIVLLTAIDPILRHGTVIGYAFRGEINHAMINYNRPYPCKEIPVSKLHPPYELIAAHFRAMETRNYVYEAVR